MKRFRLLTLVMVLSMIFCFYGMALAGGGGPDPTACASYFEWDASGNLIKAPPPDAGKFLRGDFIVARDKMYCEYEHYNVLFMLKWGDQKHLYSFPTTMVPNFCDLTSNDLMNTFASVPCQFELQDDFGLTGIPVITNMEIVLQDKCGMEDEMIRGEIVIRVAPIPEEEPPPE